MMRKVLSLVITLAMTLALMLPMSVATTKGVLATDDEYDFVRSSTPREYSATEVYSISKNGHDITVTCSDSSKGDLYIDGRYADSDVYWDFCSDGKTLYYNKKSALYRMDVATLEKEFILSDDDIFIEGVYNDKYLYYGSMKYADVTESLQDLIIYDLEEGEEVTYIKDVGRFEIGCGKIFVEPCTGDIFKLEIIEFDLDGTNKKIIANDAMSMKVLGGKLYYEAIEYTYDESLSKSRVKSYDINTGVYEDITDYYTGKYVVEFASTYAVFQDGKTLEEYTEYYKSTNNDISIVLNGTELTFDQPPVDTFSGRLLVPIRKIAESMGKNVMWNQETQTAFIDNGDTGLIIPLNEMQMYIANENGFELWDKVPLDVPAMILNDRTLVPIRAFCESLGADVNWVDEEKTAYIIYDNTVVQEQMRDTLFDTICLAYYIERFSENPFEEYSYPIDDFYENRIEWADAITMGLSDPFAGIEELMNGTSNAEDVIKMSLYEILSEIPDSSISDFDAGIIMILKDAVSTGVDIYSDVGGLGSTIRNYSEAYRYLDDMMLDYSKNYNGMVSGIFDLSVFTLEEVAYILTDYDRNMEYIGAFEDGLKDSGLLNDVTKESIDLVRTQYTDKFIGVVLDLREKCLEYGVTGTLGAALGTGSAVGKLAWDIFFTVTGVNKKGENIKLFYGTYCIDNALNVSLYNKMNNKKPQTSLELLQLRNLWKMTKAEKITAYKAMKNITNWYNKDSKQYADDCIKELENISYRLFQ